MDLFNVIKPMDMHALIIKNKGSVKMFSSYYSYYHLGRICKARGI